MDNEPVPQRARRATFREPSQRETLAVMGLAIVTQGLEAFVLLAGGLGLPLLFILASGVGAASLFYWLRYLLASDRLALLLTSAAAAAVPWVTYRLFPMEEFSGIGLLLGLVFPYGGVAVLCPCVVGLKHLWDSTRQERGNWRRQ